MEIKPKGNQCQWHWRKSGILLKFLILMLLTIGIGTIVYVTFFLPIEHGACGNTAQYRIVGRTLFIDGIGKMEDYWLPSEAKTIGLQEPPWWNHHHRITRIVISEGITDIGLYAFYQFRYLKTVVIPESVWYISGWSFQDCESLEEVYAPGVYCVDFNAFQDCSSLREVELASGSDGYTVLGEGVFRGCEELETILMHSSVFLEEKCFYGCSSLGGLDYLNPERVGAYALAGCTSLTSFPTERTREDPSIPPDRRRGSFAPSAFLNCTGLTRAELPASAETVPEAMFRGCSGLTEVIIPEGITSIGPNAFRNCTGIEDLTIPASVIQIAEDAFSGWTSAQTIRFQCNPSVVGGRLETDAKIIYEAPRISGE